VVAGDKEAAVPGTQSRQRLRMPAKVQHAAVDDVACYGDQVGLQGIDRVDNRVDVVVFDGRAHMQIANLRNGEALQFDRQAGDGDVNGHDPGAATGVHKAD